MDDSLFFQAMVVVLLISIGVSTFCYWLGKRVGQSNEYLRIGHIYESTLREVSGGSILDFWLCIDGQKTEKQMCESLRRSAERKNEQNKRLRYLEGRYKVDPSAPET